MEADLCIKVWLAFAPLTNPIKRSSQAGESALYRSAKLAGSSRAMKERLTKELRLVPAPRRRAANQRPQAVRLNDKEPKTVLDAGNEGYWSWDIPAGEFSFSEPWLELIGFPTTPKSKAGEFLKSVIHPDDLAEYESRLQAHLTGGTKAMDCECRLLTKAGAYCCVCLHGRVLRRDKRGRPLQMVGTVSGKSDHQMAYKELEQSHAQLSAIFEVAEEMIWVVDPKDFRLLTFNKRC